MRHLVYSKVRKSRHKISILPANVSNRSLSRQVKLPLVWQTMSRACRCICNQTDKESIEMRTEKRREKRIEKGSLLSFTLSYLSFRRGSSLDIFCLGVGEAEASQGRVRHHCEFQLVTEQLAYGGDKIRFRLELS